MKITFLLALAFVVAGCQKSSNSDSAVKDSPANSQVPTMKASAPSRSQGQEDLCAFLASARSEYAALLQAAKSEPNALKRETLANQASAYQNNFYRNSQMAYMNNNRHLKEFVAQITLMRMGSWTGSNGLDMSASFACPNGNVIGLQFHFISYDGQQPDFRQTVIDTPFIPWRATLENIHQGDTVTIDGEEADDGGQSWSPGLKLEPQNNSSGFFVVLTRGASLRKGNYAGLEAALQKRKNFCGALTDNRKDKESRREFLGVCMDIYENNPNSACGTSMLSCGGKCFDPNSQGDQIPECFNGKLTWNKPACNC